MRMFRLIWLILLMSIAIPSLGCSTFSSLAFSSSQDNDTDLQQAQKALEANQDQASSSGTVSSQETSEVTTSPPTIDVSKIDCENVTYSADWGLDKTLEVIRHCTNAEKEVN